MLSKTVPAPWAGFCTRIDTNPCFATARRVVMWWMGGLAAFWCVVATAFVARADVLVLAATCVVGVVVRCCAVRALVP